MAVRRLLLISIVFVSLHSFSQTVTIGAIGTYNHFNIPGFSNNFAGLGGLADFRLVDHLAFEIQGSYDFQNLNVSFNQQSTTISFVESRLSVLHGNAGLKFQTKGGSYFIFVKGGADEFRPNVKVNTVSGVPPTLVTVTTPATNYTKGIFYPGGGIEFHAGILGFRVDAGDEIFWSNGAQNNLRVTFGPTIRF